MQSRFIRELKYTTLFIVQVLLFAAFLACLCIGTYCVYRVAIGH